MSYQVEFTTKWSDFDPNRHMRHTAYNDYAAEARVRYFSHAGFPVDTIAKDGIGPVLFSEYTSFKKEIHIGENIFINAKLLGLSTDQRKWKIRHEVFNQTGKLSAIIDVYGAWIDLHKRKLTALPDKYKTLFNQMDKADDYTVL